MTTPSDRDQASNAAAARSVGEAACQLGLDSFTIYELIQRDEIHAVRASWGEFRVPQSELDRVLQPVGTRSNDERVNAQSVC